MEYAYFTYKQIKEDGLPIDTLGMQHLLLANSICWTALRHFSLSMLFDILVTAVWGHQG
jgi:GH35 family endo-1,4-beta-xylanase